ncbi:MAG: ZIP family metal transporter [Clostridia bacterium]|nr:ZIP family metal transporter [Clostridia bacterium]
MLNLFIILLPFLGTTLGAVTVFFLKNDLKKETKGLSLGFAAGVMSAAGIWSLLLPSIELAKKQNTPAFLPAVVGFFAGVIILILIEKAVLKITNKTANNNKNDDFMLFLAVTLHNIPEGMAVGVGLAAYLANKNASALASAAALSFGIAVQNFPEGAIISLPAYSSGYTKAKSFFLGTLSGIVEPIAASATLIFIREVSVLLPYLLSFASGAMFYVTVEDLIPECKNAVKGSITALSFTVGFLLMMFLDLTV